MRKHCFILTFARRAIIIGDPLLCSDNILSHTQTLVKHGFYGYPDTGFVFLIGAAACGVEKVGSALSRGNFTPTYLLVFLFANLGVYGFR